MIVRTKLTLLGLLSTLAVARILYPQEPAADLRLEPTELLLGLFYSGSDVHVSGRLPDAEGAVLVIRGAEGTVELKIKGKVGGLFWLNVGELKFERIPACYFALASGPLRVLGTPEALAEAGVGYDALAADSLGAADSDKERLFAELVKLKEKEGLFGIKENAFTLEPAEGGGARFSIAVPMPSAIPEGSYSFRLVAFHGGKGELLAERVLRVQEAGTAAWIRSLSRNHGFLYGIMAVATALAAGLLTGFLFHLGSKGGH